MTATRGNWQSTMRLAIVLALALLAAVVLGDLCYGAALLLTREPAPRPLTGDRIFHASRSAVVLLQGEYTVKASIPEADLGPGKQTEIENRLAAMVRAGQLPLDEKRIDRAAFDLMASDPDSYFVPSSKRIDDSFDLVNSGTGFFVTEDGYLITASHVVSAAKEDVKAEILQLEQEPSSVARNRADIKKSIESDVGFDLSDAELDRMASWYQSWEAKYISLDSIDARYHLASGATVEAGDRLTASGIRATLVRQEPVYPDRDVALLKADVTAVPALQLSPRDPKIGQADYVIGYPRKDFLQEAGALNASVPIVLTNGHVETRSDRSGWTAFGTNADVTHGNSGGPVLDARGDVLGTISFGADASKDAPKQNYFVPSSVVNQLLDKAGVKPRQGTATPTYYRALQEGDVKHYRHELPQLQSLADRMPANTYVKDDVIAVQSATLAGQDRTPPDLFTYWPLAAAVTGGALALLLIAVVAWRLGRQPQVAPT
jgi:serine protease Do